MTRLNSNVRRAPPPREPFFTGVFLATVLLAGAACTKSATVTGVRYKNEEPAWLVNDRRDVAEKPREIEEHVFFDPAEALIFTPASDALQVIETRRARDINALGEVPDSTWFTNRMGLRQLSPEDIARGPGDGKGPDLSAPLAIVKGKEAGAAVGFIVEDASGVRYLLKFDHALVPIIETAAEVISQRLLWAIGYHVPENTVVVLAPEQLVVTEKSTMKDKLGNKRPLTDADLAATLARVKPRPDGRYRVMLSRYLDGVPIGGIMPEGVREDDRNDTIPHQDRRVLRGLHVFFSWLQCTDVKPANSLDMWVEDPDDPKRHHVMHYLVDFGKSLGAFASLSPRTFDGHSYIFDPADDLLSMVTLGLWKRPWEGTHDARIPGVGLFDAEHFDPGAWKSHFPYLPITRKDRYDAYWASKIVMSFSPAHIRAAVEQGRLEHPDAVDHLTAVLVGRQRRIGAYWFRKVTPVDHFATASRFDGLRLCFRDLLLEYDLASPAEKNTRYVVTSYDYDGDSLGYQAQARPQSYHGSYTACVDGVITGESNDGYTIVRIDTYRNGNDRALAPIELHLARDRASGEHRVIGIHRR